MIESISETANQKTPNPLLYTYDNSGNGGEFIVLADSETMNDKSAGQFIGVVVSSDNDSCAVGAMDVDFSKSCFFPTPIDTVIKLRISNGI